MSKTEWKNGYESGFAAGWKAAKTNVGISTGGLNTQGFATVSTGTYSTTMADNPYTITVDANYSTTMLNEQKKAKKPDLKVIRNLTDHTKIV